jgi:N-acyl-D-amino-acid deacylase
MTVGRRRRILSPELKTFTLPGDTIMRSTFTLIILSIWVAALAACSDDQASGPQRRVDHLLTGGMLYDGSGGVPIAADLGFSNGRIDFIGDAASARVVADDVIDVTGRWVAPGFIDAHSHAELDEDFGKDAIPYLTQGITTVVLGMDGGGTTDVEARLDVWAANGIGVNGIHFVGHGYVRNAVLGHDDREPTDEELDSMRALVRKAMEEGAFGLSSGLFYVPGTYASTEEVIELGKVAAEFDGAIYDTHDRDLGAVYEGVGYEASVEEGIRITEESGLRGIFSHYNLQGAHNRGRAELGARLINDARERGVDIWAAQHPYTATQSNLRAYTIPYWASAGGREGMLSRFDDSDTSAEIREATDAMLEIRGGADKILFVDPRPDLNGKTLAQVSAEKELGPAEAAQSILRDGNASVMNLELYDHANTRRLAREAWMMTCTDGRTPRPDQPITHPRTFGAFPKKMRHFVFEESLLSPEFVIRSFSGLAADFYSLPDRGYLREGYVADVVVIDPDRYRDTATLENPRQLSEGVVHAIVNGRFAIRDGNTTGELAGVPLRRTSWIAD